MVKWSPAVAIRDIDRRVVLKQQTNHAFMTIPGCQRESRVPDTILLVDVDTLHDQRAGEALLSVFCGDVQQRLVIVVILSLSGVGAGVLDEDKISVARKEELERLDGHLPGLCPGSAASTAEGNFDSARRGLR